MTFRQKTGLSISEVKKLRDLGAVEIHTEDCKIIFRAKGPPVIAEATDDTLAPPIESLLRTSMEGVPSGERSFLIDYIRDNQDEIVKDALDRLRYGSSD